MEDNVPQTVKNVSRNHQNFNFAGIDRSHNVLDKKWSRVHQKLNEIQQEIKSIMSKDEQDFGHLTSYTEIENNYFHLQSE